MFIRLSFLLNTLPDDLHFGHKISLLWETVIVFEEKKKSNLYSETGLYNLFQQTRRKWRVETLHPSSPSTNLLQPRRLLRGDACLLVQCTCCRLSPPAERLGRRSGGGSAVCWQTPSSDLLISLLMTHPAALLFLRLKGQWGWEKPTGRQAGKEWGSSPHSTLGLAWRVTYLLQMSPSAKTALWEADRDMDSYLQLSKTQVRKRPQRMVRKNIPGVNSS